MADLTSPTLTLETARIDRRKGRRRTASREVAADQFRQSVRGLGLSQREYRACLSRINSSAEPKLEAKELASRYAGRCRADDPVARAVAVVEACPEFQRRRQSRKDAILRAVRQAEQDQGKATEAAERVVNGDHWLGMTWLPEVTGGELRPKAERTDKTEVNERGCGQLVNNR